MHDYILGFVCFMAGAFFVAVVGVALLGGQSEEPSDVARQAEEPSDVARQAADLPPAEPKHWPWRDPDDAHPAWPACDCPSEEFHTKYYPSAGVS
jgi:hypothetical protein